MRCDGNTGSWKAESGDQIPPEMQEFYTAALGGDGTGAAALVELDCGPKEDPDDLLTVNEEKQAADKMRESRYCSHT